MRTTTNNGFYVTGGTVPLHAASYLERSADQELFSALQAGEYCFLVNARQMGKSSLSVRAMSRLAESGVRTVFVDLAKLGGANVTPDQWYLGLLSEIGRGLDLRKEMLAYWQDHGGLSFVQRLFGALREVALEQISDKIAIFIDEIDVTRSLRFSTDEFFGAMREFYNARVTDSVHGRLVFCLVGSALPSDLVQNRQSSPFNIGKRIDLRDFTVEEALPLAQGLPRPDAEALVRRIHHWTSGHPYLTQSVCAEAAADESVRAPGDVDRIVARLFFEAKARERNVNLADVANRMLGSVAEGQSVEEHRAGILDLYSQVLRGRRVVDDEADRRVGLLKLAGITRTVDGCLQLRNRIYARVFDRRWIAEQMPDAELRRQRQAYRRGLLRATALATVILLVMAGLTWRAAVSEGRARRAAHQEELAADQARSSENRAQTALSEARSSAQRESEAAREARLARDAAQAAQLKADVARRQAQHAAGNEAVAAQRARDAARLATVLKERAERLNYIASMQLVQQAWESSPVGIQRMRDLLQETRHSPYRGWEWGYWRRKLHLETREVQLPIDLRPQDNVSYCVFSADGSRVVTVSALSTRVWDTGTGRQVSATRAVGGVNSECAISSDNRWVVGTRADASGTVQNVARICDGLTGRETAVLRGHVGPIRGSAFSPDGRRVATASEDKTARIWDRATGKCLLTLNGHTSLVYSVAFSPDGRRLATAGGDGTARIWNAATGTETQAIAGHLGQVTSVAFSPDGSLLASTGDDGAARIWDSRSGRDLGAFRAAGWCTKVAFSPDGSRVLAIEDNIVRVLDARSAVEVAAIRGCPVSISDCAFTADGKHVLTASGDGAIRTWDAAGDSEVVRSDGFPTSPSIACISSDGRRVACYDDAAKAVGVWDARAGRRLALLPLPTVAGEQFAFSVSMSRDGGRVAAQHRWGSVTVWDVATGRPITQARAGNDGIALSSDGAWLYAGRRIHYVGQSRPPVELHDWSGAAQCAAFRPDGARLATGCGDGFVRIWNARTGALVRLFRAHKDLVWAVCYARSGRSLVTTGFDNTARVWDAASGRILAVLRGHASAVNCADVSPDGRRIVTAAMDGTARLWEVTGGREITVYRALRSGNPAAAFSPHTGDVVTVANAVSIRRGLAEADVARLEEREADARRQAQRALHAQAREDRLAESHAILEQDRALRASAGAVPVPSILRAEDRDVRETVFSSGHIASPTQWYAYGWSLTRGAARSIDDLQNTKCLVFPVRYAHDFDVWAEFQANADMHIAGWSPDDLTMHAYTGYGAFLGGPDNTLSAVRFVHNGGPQQPGDLDSFPVGIAPGRHTMQFSRRNGWLWLFYDGKLVVRAGDPDPRRIVDRLGFLGGLGQTVFRARIRAQIVRARDLADRDHPGAGRLGGHQESVLAVACSPDSSRAASGDFAGTVKVWDADTRTHVCTVKAHRCPVASLCFSPDGRCLATSGKDGTVKLWDARTLHPQLTLGAFDAQFPLYRFRDRAVSFSPDGRRLACCTGDGRLRVWDTATGKLLLETTAAGGFYGGVQFSPDGKRILADSGTDSVCLLDSRTGAVVRAIPDLNDAIGGRVAFTRDGRRMGYAGKTAIHVCDTAIGAQTLALPIPLAAVSTFCFTPDGRRLVVAGESIVMWGVATGTKLAELNGHLGAVRSIDVSPDGKHLVSGGDDMTVRIWDLPPPDQISPLPSQASGTPKGR